jgi:hypothetical protein
MSEKHSKFSESFNPNFKKYENSSYDYKYKDNSNKFKTFNKINKFKNDDKYTNRKRTRSSYSIHSNKNYKDHYKENYKYKTERRTESRPESSYSKYPTYRIGRIRTINRLSNQEFINEKENKKKILRLKEERNSKIIYLIFS